MASFPQVHCPRNPCITSPLLSPIRATYPAHPILLDLITRIIFSEEYRSFSSTDHSAVQIIQQYRSLSYSLCSFRHFPVTSSLLGSNILLSTLFSNTFSLHSSLSVTDQVSHPNKTRVKTAYQEFSHIHQQMRRMNSAKFANVTNCLNS